MADNRSPMGSRRALFLLGIAAAVAIGTGLRLSTRQQLTAGGRARALTTDDYYHLRRARFAAALYPRTIVFDGMMNFPEGGVAIWPPLFDVALATPSRLLHGSSATADAVEREARWVPLFFAAGSILFAGLIGRVVAGTAGGVVLALFIAIAPGHILWTQFGHTDQHVAESFFGLLVLWLYLRSRETPSPAAEALTGVALALAVLNWQGAICWGAVVALSLFLEAIVTRRSVFRPAMLMLGLASAIVWPATAAWLGPARTPFTYISFGYFQPLFLASLAGGTVLLDMILSAARGELSRRDAAWRAAALAAAALAVLPFAGGLWLGLARGIGYVAGKTSEASGTGGYVSYPKNWLAGIYEARPLFADGVRPPLLQLSAAFFLSPLVLLLWLARAGKKERPGIHLGLAVWGSVTLFLALSQKLNVYYAAPLAGLCFLEAASLVRRLASSPRAGAVFASLAGIVLAAPMAPGIRQEVTAVRVPGSDLFETLDWMARELPHPISAYDPRLLSRDPPPELSDARSVLTPWSLGHIVLYEAELPVVANNFGYGFLDSIRFFLAESEDEGVALAGARRARWILATDLVPRMNDYAEYIGKKGTLRPGAEGLLPTPEYFRTLQSRLYDFDGNGMNAGGVEIPPLTRFRLIHQSRTGIRRGGRWLARWKLFEVVP